MLRRADLIRCAVAVLYAGCTRGPSPEYAEKVLMPEMDQKALVEIKKLEASGQVRGPALHGAAHSELLRSASPADALPDPVERAFKHANRKIYVPMQGPSEMGASGALVRVGSDSGLRKNISVPTLAIGARYDTMDPKHIKWWASQIPKGRYCIANGSHLAEYDDQQTAFIRDVDSGKMQ